MGSLSPSPHLQTGPEAGPPGMTLASSHCCAFGVGIRRKGPSAGQGSKWGDPCPCSRSVSRGTRAKYWMEENSSVPFNGFLPDESFKGSPVQLLTFQSAKIFSACNGCTWLLFMGFHLRKTKNTKLIPPSFCHSFSPAPPFIFCPHRGV